jgi:hypothetical protein
MIDENRFTRKGMKAMKYRSILPPMSNIISCFRVPGYFVYKTGKINLSRSWAAKKIKTCIP